MWRIAARLGGVALARALAHASAVCSPVAWRLLRSSVPPRSPCEAWPPRDEKYLLLAQEPMNIDVLAWWKLRDHNKPAGPSTGRVEGLPHLAHMAR